MSNLYPLLLTPYFSQRVWGTRDLSPYYSEPHGSELIGEVWLTGDECAVVSGPLAGKKLSELAKEFRRDLVGDTAPDEDRYPLLIKFLFPHEKLSVQVHPDNKMAQQMGEPCGKTECWYVLKAMPGAQIGLGLKPGTTHDQFRKAIQDVKAEGLLNWIDVHADEMFYVDAGTVHAIGPGAVLVETQQNSDTTFRLYDYGRPRELHVEQGLRAMREKTRAGKTRPVEKGGRVELIRTPCFAVDKFSLKKGETLSLEYSGRTSAQTLVALEGGGMVEAEGCPPVTFSRGQAVVIPASVKKAAVRPQWELQLLRSMVPVGVEAEPETFLV